ncbi:hypothetical protein CSC16_3990 (plasmid) [Proteus mirabilis]|nr:hypothetical protein CSC16_3990 [Proteus mirabilis]
MLIADSGKRKVDGISLFDVVGRLSPALMNWVVEFLVLVLESVKSKSGF